MGNKFIQNLKIQKYKTCTKTHKVLSLHKHKICFNESKFRYTFLLLSGQRISSSVAYVITLFVK